MADNKRTIIVTGGSRGIGRAVCLSLADKESIVFFNYFSPIDPESEAESAKETETLVAQAGGVAKGVCLDIGSTEDVEAFIKKIYEETGRIDVLVNNAGITKDGLLVRMKEKDWDDVLNINLKAAFICMKLAARMMMKQQQGRIINIASVVGVMGNPGQANYVASKAGIIGLTKSAAKELAAKGIKVNAVAPGFIETDMTKGLPEKVKKEMSAQIPLGRPGKPEDVAHVVAFLASEKADYVTGQVIHVSGGMYM